MSSTVATPTQRQWRTPSRWGRFVYFLATKAGALLLLPVARVHVQGELPDTSFLVAGNHTSVFDPMVTFKVFGERKRHVLMLGTGGLFDAPVAGSLLHAMGNIPVYRHSEARTESLREAARALRSGAIIGLYPEGRITRCAETSIEPLKTGIVRLSVETGVPVVPFLQWGTHQLVPLNRYVPSLRFFLRPQRIQVEIGEGINMRELLGPDPSREDLRRGAEVLRREMERLRRRAAGLPDIPSQRLG